MNLDHDDVYLKASCKKKHKFDIFFIFSVQSASFQFSDGEQTCILLDIDASFDLSMGEQVTVIDEKI